MKHLNLYLTVLLLLFSFALFAQSPQQIEADLLKTFKSISNYASKEDEENLADADDLFIKKLGNYTKTVPATIHYPFNQLKKEHLVILTSADGLFRIYSWDNEEGGTMRFFNNILQYRSGTKTDAVINKSGPDGDSKPMYDSLYTFKANDKTYYLATTLGIGSSKDLGKGIQVFSIVDGKLNTDTKIIKTKSGLHSQINYGYDLSLTSDKVHSEIHFDAATKSIYVPIVLGDGKLTNNYIVYKFTGQYFERVKN